MHAQDPSETSTPTLLTLEPGVAPAQVASAAAALGLWTRPLNTDDNSTIALLVEPHSSAVPVTDIQALAGVAKVAAMPSPHPLLDAHRGKPVQVGASCMQPATQSDANVPPMLMAGPCSVESPEQIKRAAGLAVEAGATLLRGGAFKPRTSPHGFTGHGAKALRWIRDAADAHGLGVVTEVLSEHDVDAVAEVADLIQLGSRNMQNFALLRAAAGTGLPVLLKRGMSARVSEWMMAAEHLLHAGAPAVIFCERGIVGFDPSTRNLLDLGAVALLSHVHQLPVVVDPSHAVGRRDLIPALACAAVAAGAHGLLVESHHDAASALSDGAQALSPQELCALGGQLGLSPATRANNNLSPQRRNGIEL